MIKINLATRKQSGLAVEQKGQKSANKALASIDMDQLKELPIRKVAIPLLVAFLASHWLDGYKEDEINKLQSLIGKVSADGNKLKKDLEKFKSYDAIKKSLDEDELVIKTKLDTIHKLILRRGETTQVLSSMSSAIPEEGWLNELRLENKEIYLKGAAAGFSQISDFMKNLNDNSRFSNAELKNSQQEKDNVSGAEIANFEITVKEK